MIIEAQTMSCVIIYHTGPQLAILHIRSSKCTFCNHTPKAINQVKDDEVELEDDESLPC